MPPAAAPIHPPYPSTPSHAPELRLVRVARAALPAPAGAGVTRPRAAAPRPLPHGQHHLGCLARRPRCALAAAGLPARQLQHCWLSGPGGPQLVMRRRLAQTPAGAAQQLLQGCLLQLLPPVAAAAAAAAAQLVAAWGWALRALLGWAAAAQACRRPEGRRTPAGGARATTASDRSKVVPPRAGQPAARVHIERACLPGHGAHLHPRLLLLLLAVQRGRHRTWWPSLHQQE